MLNRWRSHTVTQPVS